MTVSNNIPAKRKCKVPAYLIYETLSEKPLYYKGYKEVLNKKKSPEEIIDRTSVQLLTSISIAV